jgi:Prenyltransferase and squalene oxidase repeat
VRTDHDIRLAGRAAPHSVTVVTLTHAVSEIEDELVRLVADLGRGGGIVTPAIYDTAQVARFAPAPGGAEPALAWLRAQQDADGGWGGPAHTFSRHISTLAAMLALPGTDAAAAGARYLRTSAAEWAGAEPDDLPVGGEVVLRRLVLDAADTGLDVDPEPYRGVLAEAERRVRAICSTAWPAGTPPLSVWEAWGDVPDPAEQSAAGDVGTCPAATARWLAAGVDGPAAARAAAYLERAAGAARTGVPGVVPFVFPFERMEQAFALYALVLAADSLPPRVRAAVEAPVRELDATFRARGGASHTDVFVADGDDTAVVAAVLTTFGADVEAEPIRAFERDDHFRTWDFEFTPSVTTTAHCVHALALLGERCEPAVRFILDRRGDSGLWERDKWHTSWAYVTAQCIPALCLLEEHEALAGAWRALCERQRPDGGFGASIETAYALISLAAIERALGEDASEARRDAGRHLRKHRGDQARLWIGKEQYRMERIDRAWELAALAIK